MTSWAKVGARVVCVDAGPSANTGLPVNLVVGRIYTIVRTTPVGVNGLKGVVVVEARAPSERYGFGFAVNRFRPIVTKTQKQDVEMFLSLLSDNPQSTDA